MRKAVALIGTAMLVALLPTAAQPANRPAPMPTVTIPPILPLPAEPAPSHRDESNHYALAELAENPAHYQCHRYPSPDKVQLQDLVPTGNVSMQFKYDTRTGRYETTVVDPRIVVAHHTESRRMVVRPGHSQSVTSDVYQWRYSKGVVHYGAFAYSTVGRQQWVRPYPQPLEDGFYQLELIRQRHDHDATVVVIATDTSTCKPGNAMPSSLWPDARAHGLIG